MSAIRAPYGMDPTTSGGRRAEAALRTECNGLPHQGLEKREPGPERRRPRIAPPSTSTSNRGGSAYERYKGSLWDEPHHQRRPTTECNGLPRVTQREPSPELPVREKGPYWTPPCVEFPSPGIHVTN